MDNSLYWPIAGSALFTLAAAFAFLYQPIRRHKAYRLSLLTLARAVEAKDVGSEGHGERVAKYVVAVAKGFRISGEDRTNMEYAAFLQDIGNVRVPHAILNKTGKLTPEEFEILKSHTTSGAEMVEQIKFLKKVAPIIRHHHESWDGTGYPDGLQEKAIPLGSRILAVCTAYDAMMQSRSYREGLDEESAIRELRALAGAKYDPEVVDVFLKVLKEEHSPGGRRS